MQRHSLWIPALAVLLVTRSLAAAPPSPYERLVLAEYAGDPVDTRILSQGCGRSVVAWTNPDGVICSRTYASGTLGPLVEHGSGRDPVLSDANAVWLAWASDAEIVIREESGAWLPSLALTSGFPEEAHHPDFSFGDTGPSIAWLQGARILFSSRDSNGSWAAPEVIATDVNTSTWMGLQLEAMTNRQPRVYYFLEDYRPAYRERTEFGAWSETIVWPDTHWDFAWPFRVVASGGAYGLHSVLHVGVYRTCPCNEILFEQEIAPGAWAPLTRLTVERDEYNLPAFCGLAAGPDRSVHTFWHQSFFDFMLQPSGEDMFYRVHTGSDLWTTPWTFDAPVGRYTDVSVGHCLDGHTEPEFCWIEEDGDDSKVVLLRYAFDGSDVPETQDWQTLVVAPNPSRESVRIEWSSGTPLDDARVLDASGRTVRQFSATTLSRDPVTWDGRGDNGLLLPAGVYWVRVRSAGGAHEARVIRMR